MLFFNSNSWVCT